MTGIIALSGGVDSAVAAERLRSGGRRPVGVYMRHRFQPTKAPNEESLAAGAEKIALYEFDGGDFVQSFWSPEKFPLPSDALFARQVAQKLEIDFAIFNAEPLFEQVTDDFVANYLDGQTPNPCVLCNRILKFGALVRLAQKRGGTFFATGHYVSARPHADWLAAVQNDGNNPPEWLANQPNESVALSRSPFDKDQSYVLWNIDKSVLPLLEFPLGSLSKEQVRAAAKAKNLPVADKKESQDVCFIPNGKHADFIRANGDGRETTGDFVSADGRILGQHAGYEKYTVGQRKGLGIGFGERTFVERIDAANRRVILGSYEALAVTEVSARRANWLVDVPMDEPFRCEVKVRYRNRPAAATVITKADGTIRAKLDEARYGVAPGQSLVCYFGDRLLGGGVIQ